MHGTIELNGRRTGPPARRERNSLRIVEALRDHGHASRGELARSTGLSRATVSSIVADLEARGLVTAGAAPGAPPRPRRGRPPAFVRLHRTAGAGLAFHFDGRGIDVAVADLSSTILAERRAVLPAADLASTVEAAATAAADAIGRARVSAAAVRGAVLVGGPASANAAAALSGRLGIGVRVEDDASMSALGELTSGVAHGLSDVVYVHLSSTIRAGLVIGARLHRGARGAAGALGHVQVSPDGALCRCGNRGCLETEAALDPVLGLLRSVHGPDLTVGGLLELLGRGDPGARRVVGDAGRAVGKVLAGVCNTLNPQAIVLGGELSTSGEPLVAGVRESLDRYAQPEAARVDVRTGSLGRRAPLLGALAAAIRSADRTARASA